MLKFLPIHRSFGACVLSSTHTQRLQKDTKSVNSNTIRGVQSVCPDHISELLQVMDAEAVMAAVVGVTPETAEGSTRSCWKCGASVPRVSFFFCEECNILQPAVQGADYFLLLDV